MMFRKFKLGRSLLLGAVGVTSMAICAGARADVVVFTSGNASASVDESTGTVTGLQVGGVPQMAQQSFFYRIGETGPEESFSTLTPTGVSTFPGSVFLNYSGPGFTVSLSYSLSGGSDNVSPAQLLNELFVSSTSFGPAPGGSTIPADGQITAPIDLHVFQYDHFTLDGSLTNNIVSINTDASEVDQVEADHHAAIRDASASVVALGNEYAVGTSPSILNQLTDGSPTTLNDSVGPVGPGSVEFALQSDTILGDLQTFPVISIDTFNPGVPVPQAVWMGLTTLGCIAGIGALRRIRIA